MHSNTDTAATDTEHDAPTTDQRVIDAREEIIDMMVSIATRHGGVQSHGRLYGILFLAGEPLSIDQLAARSDYAKSTVSTSMRALERHNLIRQRSLPDEGKRLFYEIDQPPLLALQESVLSEMSTEIHRLSGTLADVEQTLSSADSQRARHHLERVRVLQEFRDQSETLLTSLSTDS